MRQRAIFLFNFTRQIGWPSSFETFKIGVLGDDPVTSEIERLISRGRLVLGRPVELVALNSINEVAGIQLVYVNEKYGYDITQLLQHVKEKGILVVSENYPFNSSMINMVLVEGSFQFEIQQDRLESENFKLTEGFKNLAITSANRWQALYEKSTQRLEEEKKRVEEQESLITQQEQMILQQSSRITSSNEKLRLLNEEYDQLIARNTDQEKLFEERTNELTNLEAQYERTLTEIDQRQSKIQALDSTLNARQVEIEKQSDLINTQNTSLKVQREELDYQKNFTLLSVAIAVLALTAGFFIWKNYREKKKSNIVLETKNNEIEATSRELRMVNKEMEQFAYLASHDLQEPLNTITGWLRIINKDQLDQNGQLSVNLIDGATNRMRSLIRGLLEYSKLGNHADLENIDANELIQEVLNNLTAVIEKTEAKIEVKHLPRIRGHQLRLGMLFQNLISNALKFTKENETPIVIISAKPAGKQGFWEFNVQDNGIGIAEENLGKIFDIFHREHSRDKYEGTGIGLAHVRKIVEIHEGQVWVESTLGEGTSFHFTLQTADVL